MPIDWHRIHAGPDAIRLRDFLRLADPEDYLLEDLEEWAHEGRLWIGEEAGEWIAFGRLHDLGEGEGWISGVRVLPSRRGQGLGGALLREMLSDARSIGLTTVRAVIEDPNTPSRRLFERNGFRPVAAMALRRGAAGEGGAAALHRAGPQERPDGPVEWFPALVGRVDLLPGEDAGRFGRWRESLLGRWAREGKLWLASGLAVVVQVDWWRNPRTLWAHPLRGEPEALLPEIGQLARSLDQAEWQAFFPSTERLRTRLADLGALPHPSWGDRVQLYERPEPPSTPASR